MECTDTIRMFPHLEQINHDNRKICDGECENTYYTQRATQTEMCGSGSGDNSQTVNEQSGRSAAQGLYAPPKIVCIPGRKQWFQ